MPIYSPTGFLDVTNATLRTSNLEAENFKLNGGNIYVSTDFTVAPTLQLITNGGSVTSNTVQFTNVTTGLVADSNIVVTGNVTAGYLHGDASNVTAVPAAQVTGTLVVANGGTGTTTSTGTGSVVLSDAPTFTGDVTFDTDTLFIDSVNNRVGVGTTSPGAKMDIYTGSTGTVGLSFDRFASGNYRTDIYQNTYGLDFRVGYAENTPESVLYLKRFSDGSKEVEINGNVGIGTTDPATNLHVFHPTYGVHRSIYWSENPGNPASQNPIRMGYLGSSDPSHASGGLGLFKNTYEGGLEDEAVRIQANGVSWFKGGNVGIGTDSPDCNLEIYGDTSSIKLTRSRNNTNYGCSVDFALLNSVNEKFTYGRLTGSIADNTDGSEDGFLSFQVGTNGNMQSNYQEEKMRILSDGNVGIGTTIPQAKLHVNGPEIRVTNVDTAVAQISAYGSTQGTGRLYVGQSATYGGGIEYNGDNNPASTGAGADYITLYRVDNGTYNWTARNLYNNNDWEFRGTISYNTKQATHQKNEGLTYTSSNTNQNLKTVTISADGIAHVHVTGLWRMSAFDGTNGTDTEAAYFSIRKNSTEVTAGSVGHRVAKLGNVNDTNQWKPIVMSWSGAVSSGDTINVYATTIENNIQFNELDLNVLVV